MLIKIKEHEDYIYYRALCECTCKDCDVDATLEVDDWGYMTLTFHVEATAYPYKYDTWYTRAWWRVTTAIKILFKGRVDMQHDIMIADPKQFQKQLDEGVSAMDKVVAKRKAAIIDKEYPGFGTQI